MKDLIKKSVLLGLGAASLTKNQADKIIKELMKRNAVTVNDGRHLLGKISKAAEQEKKRIANFASQELQRVAKSVGTVPKAKIQSARKVLKKLDKELSKRGKKVLDGALKQLLK